MFGYTIERDRERVYSRSEEPLFVESSFIRILIYAFALFTEHVKVFYKPREYNVKREYNVNK